MKIEINTRYSIGDVVFAFYNGAFCKVKIDRVKVMYDSDYRHQDVMYHAIQVAEAGDDCVFAHDFQEYEILSKDDLIEALHKLENS